MYIYDKQFSGLETGDERSPLVLRPFQSARFYPHPHSSLGEFHEPDGLITLSMRPQPFLNLDRFAFNQPFVPGIQKANVKTLAKHIVDSQQAAQRVVQIRLVGHTDPVGNEAYNDKLGLDRANAVKTALEFEIENLKPGLVKGTHRQVDIVTESRGKKELITTDQRKGDLNRRVQVFITTSPAPQPAPPSGSSGPKPPVLTLPTREGFDFEQANRERYKQVRVPAGLRERSVRQMAREKAIDFVRGKGLSRINAERVVDLAERGAKTGFDKALEELGVGSTGRDAIVNVLRATLEIPF